MQKSCVCVESQEWTVSHMVMSRIKRSYTGNWFRIEEMGITGMVAFHIGFLQMERSLEGNTRVKGIEVIWKSWRWNAGIMRCSEMECSQYQSQTNWMATIHDFHKRNIHYVTLWESLRVACRLRGRVECLPIWGVANCLAKNWSFVISWRCVFLYLVIHPATASH